MWSCQVTLSFIFDCQIICIQGCWNCHVQLVHKTCLAGNFYWLVQGQVKNKVGIKNQSINHCFTFSKFLVFLFGFFHSCFNFIQNTLRSCLYYGDLEYMFLNTSWKCILYLNWVNFCFSWKQKCIRIRQEFTSG